MTAESANSTDGEAIERPFDDNRSTPLPAQASQKIDDIPVAQRRDEDLDEADPDTLIEKAYNVADLAVAASFGGALPGAISMFHASLVRTLEFHGEYSLSNGGGPVGELSREELAEKRDEEAADDLSEMFEEVERKDEERRREEWAQSSHKFAGQDWTGEEWGEAAEDLKKGNAGRSWLVSYLTNKKHQTKEQAETLADDMQLASSGESKHDADRTQAEKDAMTRVKDNPLAEDAYAHMRDAREKGFEPVQPETRAIASSHQAESVVRRQDSMYEEFPSAPKLDDHYQAALAATAPFDAKPAPQLIAVNTPQPAPSVGAGLDV